MNAKLTLWPMAMALVVATCLAVLPSSARAACSASVTNLDFGSVHIRAGEVNSTSGTLTVTCSGILNVAVGVCVRFGPGSGGADADLSPRYMRRSDSAILNYELRPDGNGAAFGTLETVYVNILLSLGSGSVNIPIYADITSNTTAVGTGSYSSTFSGASNISLDYSLLSCSLLGTSGSVSPFTVSADVQSSCELSVGALDFGTISNVISSPVDQTASIAVSCTQDTPYAVTLDMGLGAGVTDPAFRLMKNGTNTLSYGLYQDAARSAPWGNLATNDVDATGTGTVDTYTVYGRINAGQTAVLGTYTDSVVVTVTY
jgi:spore coat protein U-like protein